jgi:hypothetical protein
LWSSSGSILDPKPVTAIPEEDTEVEVVQEESVCNEDDAELSDTERLLTPTEGRAPSRGRAEDRVESSGSGWEVGSIVGIGKKADEASDTEGASGIISIFSTACCCAIANDSKACTTIKNDDN